MINPAASYIPYYPRIEEIKNESLDLYCYEDFDYITEYEIEEAHIIFNLEKNEQA